ncbi:tRNA 4-thiouridine(8) synthase ThiI [Desulfobacterota bacterium AH_259_B03_O07]|nr:tRNA 4-thiouridine(8) synthase ThiI [Desulfobacterota bacterium AH_259_B03_O07]
MTTLIHYGELALKRKNRRSFENILIENLKKSSGGRIRRLNGRLILEDGDLNSIKRVFGVSWFAHSYRMKKSLEAIIDTVIEKLGDVIKDSPTFGVIIKRADKSFPHTSLELAKRIGKEVINRYNLEVRLNNPDLAIHVEIAEEVFVYFKKVEGLGGLPVGVSGTVLCLLSGGIDSPVAAYLMMKRGCRVNYIHFHSYSANKAVLGSKIADIVRLLSNYGFESRVYLAPYNPFQFSLLEKGIPSRYELVLFRRLMLQVAEKIAKDRGYKGIATGDSIGQVASQTLDNLKAVMGGISLPILQPLICFDKREIIDLAKDVGSYEMSIKPYKDCCSILAPHPKTKTRIEQIDNLEEKMNMEKVIKDTLGLVEVYEF